MLSTLLDIASLPETDFYTSDDLERVAMMA